MEPLIKSESLKYSFSPEEIVSIAKEQARHHNTLNTYETELEQIKADYKAKMTATEAAISACTLRITSGYEMRMVKQLVLKFRPDAKSKLIVRLDNGRGRVEKMEKSETQMTLTTTEDPFIFETDFAEDIEGPLSVLLAENVPLTKDESDALREVCQMRPLRRQIGNGSDVEIK